ncbi:MAG: hypothetical protein ABW360_06100 [Phenylobacterium sp.]
MSEVSQDLLPKAVSPNAFVGVASPLWGLFAGAAASGIAFWWMTRWTRPQNLEAMFGAMTAKTEALVAPVTEAIEALPELPVGGESAPISPLVEAAAEVEAVVSKPVETVVEAVAETANVVEEVVEARVEAAEAVVEAQVEAAEAVVEAQVEAVEAVVEAAPEPVIPKPIVKAAPKPKPKAPSEPRSIAPRSQPAAQPK